MPDLTDDGFSAVILEPPPAPGHNQPPGLAAGDVLLNRVKLTHKELFDRAAQLLASEERMPKADDGKTILCTDDDWERKLTEVARQLSECATKMDTARTAEIAPYRDCVSGVHGLFRDVMDRLIDPDKKTTSSLRHRVERALTAFKLDKAEKERKRLADEAEKKRKEEEAARLKAKAEADAAAAEAERLRLEAEKAAAAARGPKTNQRAEDLKAAADRAAEQAASIAAEGEQAVAAKAEETAKAEAATAAPAATFTRARSANAMSSLQEFVDFRDVNRDRLDLDTLRAHIPADALDQALRSYIRANNDALKEDIKNRRQPVRGVTFYMNARTGTR